MTKKKPPIRKTKIREYANKNKKSPDDKSVAEHRRQFDRLLDDAVLGIKKK